jgi:hypothetical protein
MVVARGWKEEEMGRLLIDPRNLTGRWNALILDTVMVYSLVNVQKSLNCTLNMGEFYGM